MSQQSILVLGAGELGTCMLNSLATHNINTTTQITCLVTASSISRPSPTKQAEHAKLRSSNISLLPGNIYKSSVSELATLFAPFDTIIGCTGMTAPSGTQIKFCKAVLANQKLSSNQSSKRYIPWQFGMDYDAIGRGSSQDLFNEQLDVRDALRAQRDVEWIIMSTGLFTSFLFEPSFGVVTKIDNGTYKVLGLGGLHNRITVTSPLDIGRVVARVVLDDWDSVKNHVVYVAGDTISYQDVATIVQEVSGTMTATQEKTAESLRRELAQDPENGMLKYQATFAEGKGVAWDLEQTYNQRNGMTMETARDYFMKHESQGNEAQMVV